MGDDGRWLPDAVRELDDASPRARAGAAWDVLVGYLESGRWDEEAAPGWLGALRAAAGRELAILAVSCARHGVRARSAATAVLLAWWDAIELEAPDPAPDASPDAEQDGGADGEPDEAPADEAEPAADSEQAPGSPPMSADASEEATARSAEDVVKIVVDRAMSRGHDAVDDVDALETTLSALIPWGGGWHPRGTVLERVMLDKLEELARILARMPELRRIAERLGKLEATERRGRGTERGGRETVVGVRVGGELADVLPCELALLADPDAEDLFYARLAERRLLSFAMLGELEGDTPTRRRAGPVIACVDTSGSMRGAPEEIAKAVVLAVARRVVPAGRRVAVILFGGRGAFTEAIFAPRRADLDVLTRFLTTSYHGGTDLEGPVRHALALRETPGFEGADLLLITDGIAPVGGDLAHRLGRLRRKDDLEVVTVLLGPQGSALEAVSDAVWRVEDPGEGGATLRRYA